MLIHVMDHLLKQPDVDFFLLSPYHVTPLFPLSRPDAGLVAYLILNASSVGNTVFPHHHSFRPQGRHFSGPPTPLPWVSSLNFLSLLDLHILTNPSRLERSICFLPTRWKTRPKTNISTVHGCCGMLEKGSRPESAPPSP